MQTMIVATQIFVTREAVQMHVDYLNVERMLNVKALSIQQSVYVCQVTQGIPDLHVIYVSLQIFSIGLENLQLFKFLFYVILHEHTKSMFSIIVGLPTAPVLSVGCLQNEDCPLYTACKNTKCINPCAEDNPCAPTAICKVLNHEPKCTCPDGYIGSPLTDCRPRKLPPHWFESLHVCNHHISIIKTMTNHDLVSLNRNNHNRTSLCYTQFLNIK